ncbi:EAL domain-containing protein [Candidatus Methylospira mobilis]|nr:EAL domain-containing protein [Candidatus Methylospira mobilis]WNV04484.1 EAL domain-containing protein [Candidatus Methylospira mobilis]
MSLQDDDLVFLDELNEESAPVQAENYHKLLIVDDDPDVHAITLMALSDFRFHGAGLSFLSAYSAAEARNILDSEKNIALILLDVVMESDDAGLQLVRYVREYQANWFTRIILRTGQPGQAPEFDVIVNYDINDYKDKTELTAVKLYTTVFVSLRAYRQMLTIEMSRQGLVKILSASNSLFEYQSMNEFVQGVVLQLRSLIDCIGGAMLCGVSDPGSCDSVDAVRVVASAGELEKFAPGSLVTQCLPPDACELISQAISTLENIYADSGSVIVFRTVNRAVSVVYLRGEGCLSQMDRYLLEIFCNKVALGFDNIYFIDQMRQLARHEPLTNLLNREALVNELKNRLLNAADTSAGLGVIVIGLDRFKDVNTDLGYAAGDRLLRVIASRLCSMLTDTGLASRLGADQFAVIVSNILSANELRDLTDKLLQMILQPVELEGEEVLPAASLGFVFVSGRSLRPAYDLIAEAEAAMAEAKRLGGNRVEQAVSSGGATQSGRLTLIRDLSYALDRKELRVLYQPIYKASSRQLAGFEALLRWHHPERGSVVPDKFIAEAEVSGLIVPIGSWVLRTATADALRWHASYAEKAEQVKLSVNVSARQLLTSDLVGMVERIIDESAIAPALLKLEITESMIMEDPARVEAMMLRLKDMGVCLSLDDFGTGYSSISYLHRYPFDTLKLDRSFVSTMFDRKQSMPIIQAVVRLAEALNIETIAEGVETENQARTLLDIGCDYLQGYFFGRPMTIDDANQLVADSL